MKQRMLPILLSLALLLGLIPTSALAADTAEYVEYSWNEDAQTLSSSTKSISNYTVVNTSTTSWDGSTTDG